VVLKAALGSIFTYLIDIWRNILAVFGNYACSAPSLSAPLSRSQVTRAIVDDAAGLGTVSIRLDYEALDFPPTRSIGAAAAAALTRRAPRPS